MKKITIIYWSGTGNTAKMANAIFQGAKNNNNLVEILDMEKVTIEDVINSDIIALGCPAMGDENLEEEYMEPFINSIESMDLSEKTIVLFGAYGGGNGKWMIEWVNRMEKCCENVKKDGLIIHRDVIDENLEKCEDLGKLLTEF